MASEAGLLLHLRRLDPDYARHLKSAATSSAAREEALQMDRFQNWQEGRRAGGGQRFVASLFVSSVPSLAWIPIREAKCRIEVARGQKSVVSLRVQRKPSFPSRIASLDHSSHLTSNGTSKPRHEPACEVEECLV